MPVGGVQDFFIFVFVMKVRIDSQMLELNDQMLELNDQMLEQLCVMVDTVTADVREIVASGQYPVVVLLRGYELLEVLQDAMPALQDLGVMPVLQKAGAAQMQEKTGAAENLEQTAEQVKLQGAGVVEILQKAGAAESPEQISAQEKLQEVGTEAKLHGAGVVEKLQEALLGYAEEFAVSGQRLMEVLDREVIARKAEGYLQPWKRRYEKAQGEYKKAVELHEAAKVAHQAQCEGGFVERWKTLRMVRKMAGFRLERRRTGNFVARTLDLMQQAMLVAREAELAMYSHNVEYKCNPDVYIKINELLTQKT